MATSFLIRVLEPEVKLSNRGAVSFQIAFAFQSFFKKVHQIKYQQKHATRDELALSIVGALAQ